MSPRLSENCSGSAAGKRVEEAAVADHRAGTERILPVGIEGYLALGIAFRNQTDILAEAVGGQIAEVGDRRTVTIGGAKKGRGAARRMVLQPYLDEIDGQPLQLAAQVGRKHRQRHR